MTTLAELRLANLREQKKSAEPAPAPEPAPVAPPEPAGAVPEPPAAREGGLVLAQFVPDAAPAPAPAEQASAGEAAAEDDPEAERTLALIARVHAALAVKTQHPNGAKATVDMSPALFHRAKRYCLDHGNVTLRQLFLDLMTAFLDEEGY